MLTSWLFWKYTKKTKERHKMSNNELLAHAKNYLAAGFSVIPVSGNKRPALPGWKDYQSRLPTEQELEIWFAQSEVTGIAIITGKLSGLVVIDFEKYAKLLELPDTVKARTGGGGIHYYFRYPQNSELKSATRIWDLTDIRADGGIIIVPPSVSYKGKYEWIKSFDDIPLAEFPEYLLDIIKDKSTQIKTEGITMVVGGVPEGGRNTASTQIVGKLLHHFPKEEWRQLVWPLVEAWNQNNKPPLPIQELTSVFNAIAKNELLQRRSETVELGEPTHISDLLAKPDEPVSWIVRDLLFAGSINIISAPPKNFKTWVLLHIACKVAVGEKVFGHFNSNKTKVLFIQEEDFETIVKKRLRSFSAESVSGIYFWVQRGFKVDKAEHLQKLLNFIKEKSIGLVLMDSFRRVTFLAENDSKEVAVFFSRLMEITRAGATVLMTHHDRKDSGFGSKLPEQKMRGSSDIFAALHSHLSVERNFKDDTLTISQTKIKVQEEMDPFVIKINSDRQTSQVQLEYAGVLEKQEAQKEKAKHLVLDFLLVNGETSKADITKTLISEVGKNSITQALQDLVAEEYLILRKAEKGGKNFYSLRQAV